ncbi:MAG: sigma-70 family RNA polymerase sigma factor, partial [Planctomycetales bacterium]|nr:sigma-70 family RNA polymerase sigma factor [Planctomycetales bacterium]
ASDADLGSALASMSGPGGSRRGSRHRIDSTEITSLQNMDCRREPTDRVRTFATLLDQHHRGLFAFVRALVPHYADAEDVYQQVALVLWKKFDDFEIGTNFRAWSAQVARNTARDFLRSQRRLAPCFSDDFLEALAAAHIERSGDEERFRAEALQRCLDKLSHRDRKLVDECYAPDRDFSAIAKSQNRSIDAIYQAISRIRKNLARCVRRSLTSES